MLRWTTRDMSRKIAIKFIFAGLLIVAFALVLGPTNDRLTFDHRSYWGAGRSLVGIVLVDGWAVFAGLAVSLFGGYKLALART
ncbi:hypothetical protein ABIA23_006875 [Sinorhizobium fredii]